MLGLNDK